MRDLLKRLFRRSSLDEQVPEEIEGHIAMRAEANREAGMSREEACRKARLQFGSAVSVRETLSDFNKFGGWRPHCRISSMLFAGLGAIYRCL